MKARINEYIDYHVNNDRLRDVKTILWFESITRPVSIDIYKNARIRQLQKENNYDAITRISDCDDGEF